MLHATDHAEVNTADSKKRKKVSLDEMHRTFGHIDVEWLKNLLVREGYEVVNDFKGCNHCIEGKMHRTNFRSEPLSARAPGIG